MTPIIAILAMDQSCLIGSNQGLPWRIPADMEHFRELTMGHTVIMGRRTYFSLPAKYRPLPGRRNIVITHEKISEVETCDSIENCLKIFEVGKVGIFGKVGKVGKFFKIGKVGKLEKNEKTKKTEKVYIIGGAQIYNEFFQRGLIDRVELTLVDGVHEGDVFIHDFRENYTLIETTPFDGGQFQTWVRA